MHRRERFRRVCKKTRLLGRKFIARFNMKRAQRKQHVGTCLLWRMSLLVIVLAVVYGITIKCAAGGFENTGTFGDTYGALNTLFSGLAFAGIIASIWMQHEELKLQRKELELQRKEMAKQAQELKGQHDEIERQRKISERYEFERFFKLLFEELKLSHLESISCKIIYSHFCEKIYNILKVFEEQNIKNIDGIFNIELPKDSGFKFKKYISCKDSKNFLKKFERIFLYIHQCEDEDNREIYFDIVINELSHKEKIIIFIYYFLDYSNGIRKIMLNFFYNDFMDFDHFNEVD